MGRAVALLAATFLAAASPAGAKPHAPTYEVGVAARSINPDADGTFAGKPVYLGGYGFGSLPEGRTATGILGEGIKVRAIAVSGGRGNV